MYLKTWGLSRTMSYLFFVWVVSHIVRSITSILEVGSRYEPLILYYVRVDQKSMAASGTSLYYVNYIYIHNCAVDQKWNNGMTFLSRLFVRERRPA